MRMRMSGSISDERGEQAKKREGKRKERRDLIESFPWSLSDRRRTRFEIVI